MDWMEFAARYGLTGTGLVGLVWFLAKHVWPFFVNLYHEQQSERREERQRFLDTSQAFLDTMGQERRAFQDVVTSERMTRLEERERFLAALREHREQLAFQLANIAKGQESATRAQEEMARVQIKMLEALEKMNVGH